MNTKTHFALSARAWNARITSALDLATEAIAFWALVLWTTLGRWWEFRRVCAWCGARLGGNPLAKTTSHGICRACAYHLTHP